MERCESITGEVMELGRRGGRKGSANRDNKEHPESRWS
jgi:hypothetical protein